MKNAFTFCAKAVFAALARLLLALSQTHLDENAKM